MWNEMEGNQPYILIPYLTIFSGWSEG